MQLSFPGLGAPAFGAGTGTGYLGSFSDSNIPSAAQAGDVPTIGYTPDSFGPTPGLSLPGIGAPQTGGGGLFGLSNDTLKLGLGGLQTIGGLYAAFKSAALAKAQFNFTKGLATANLGNQIQSYNTTLEDKAKNRQFVQGDPAGSADAYVSSHKLVMPKLG